MTLHDKPCEHGVDPVQDHDWSLTLYVKSDDGHAHTAMKVNAPTEPVPGERVAQILYEMAEEVMTRVIAHTAAAEAEEYNRLHAEEDQA